MAVTMPGNSTEPAGWPAAEPLTPAAEMSAATTIPPAFKADPTAPAVERPGANSSPGPKPQRETISPFWAAGQPWHGLRNAFITHLTRAVHSSLMCSLDFRVSGLDHLRPYLLPNQPPSTASPTPGAPPGFLPGAPPGVLPGAILACWHCDLLAPLYLLQGLQITALASPSREGLLAAGLWRAYGWRVMLGSSRHPTGIGSLRHARRLLKAGQFFALAPDGPLGPAQEVHAGLVYLASQVGSVIVPSGFAAHRPWRLHTWDRMVIPRPCSRVHFHVGTPVQVPPNLDRPQIMEWQHRLNRALEAAEEEAAARLH